MHSLVGLGKVWMVRSVAVACLVACSCSDAAPEIEEEDAPSQPIPSPNLAPMGLGPGWHRVHSGYFWGLWGSSETDVWAIGGHTSHFDGTAWREVDAHRGTRIWGSGPSDIWTVGSAGFCCAAPAPTDPIFHFDGSAWKATLVPGAELDAIWGSSPSDVWASGVGKLFHYDGTTWLDTGFGPGYRLSGLWGSGPRDIWLFGGAALTSGAGGRYSHYDGTSWSGVTVAPALARNDAMWGSGPRDVWSVGDGVMHWDGTSWTLDPALNGLPRFYGVWGTGPRDVFAVRENGVVLHFDGVSWSSLSFPYATTLRAVWGADPLGTAGGAASVWVAGESGIYQWIRP